MGMGALAGSRDGGDGSCFCPKIAAVLFCRIRSSASTATEPGANAGMCAALAVKSCCWMHFPDFDELC